VVTQLMEALAFDWQFTTGELLHGDAFFPAQEAVGPVVARAIPAGPDEDHETLTMTLLGVLAEAQQSVRIVTPYFLPDQSVIDALRVAALRGVRVEIVLPGRGNLRLVQWAMTAQLWQVLRWGCRVFVTPPPFDHAKLMTVDGTWSLIGSANWDPRSLRLNFELAVECYCTGLARALDGLIDARLGTAEPVSLRDVDARPVPVKLRDGVARLLQPYL
jgi:cardiolipin synthase